MNLTTYQVKEAAKLIKCHPAAIMAVIHVETPAPHKGDLPDGTPLILNERHWFHKLTKGVYSSSFPDISFSKPGDYCKGKTWIDRQKCEHYRLNRKLDLDRNAALKSISMGLFQMMGFNHNVLGYKDVESMWQDARKVDDSIDLGWFITFVKVNRLDDELRNLDWAGFARGYNGPGYKANKYDQKLAMFFDSFRLSFDEFSFVDNVRKMKVLPPIEHAMGTGFPDFSQLYTYEIPQGTTPGQSPTQSASGHIQGLS
jgi:hypothetical protein